MKSLIFGYGLTGQSFDRHLTKQDIQFDIFDIKKVNHPQAFNELPNKEKLNSYEMVYLSPGINIRKLYPNREFDQINYLTDLDIFFEQDNSYKIGITGTNGKSTCCFHLNILLGHSQILGNFGTPLLDNINSGKTFSVIELSSFQLEKMHTNALDLGVLLNIFPDHIDHHGSFEAYQKSKERIYECKNHTNERDPFNLYKIITGKEYDGKYCQGEYNIRLDEYITPMLPRLPHRLEELTGLMGEKKINLHIINDSKSTNLASLQYALRIKLFGRDFSYLILCGDPSKEQYKNFILNDVDVVYIFGKHANEINQNFLHPNKKIFRSIHQVLMEIRSSTIQRNKRRGKKGGVVLFSPGHPSGGDYRNFEERGDHFKKLVKEIFLND